MESVNGLVTLPEQPFTGTFATESEAVDWALLWLPEGGELLTESYVNLIPTQQGGRMSTVCVRGSWMRCVSSVSSVICCRVG